MSEEFKPKAYGEGKDWSKELPKYSGVRVQVHSAKGLLLRAGDHRLPDIADFKRLPTLGKEILLIERPKKTDKYAFPAGVSGMGGGERSPATEDEILLKKILNLGGNIIHQEWESVAIQRVDGTFLVIKNSFTDSNGLPSKHSGFLEGNVIDPQDIKEIDK